MRSGVAMPKKHFHITRSMVAIISSCLLLATFSYWFLKKSPYSRVTFKTNSLQTILTTRKHIVSNLLKSAGIYFWNKYLPTWRKGIEPTAAQKKEMRRLFHFNPSIEHVIDENPEHVINHKRPTIYFHGWGDTKNSAKLLKAYGDVLPGDLITFHFHDRGVILPKLRHANLGQLPDVLTALYVLNWTKNIINPEALDLYGYSRGGATILNLIAVLNDPAGTYEQELDSIGISDQDRTELLELIQNGTIVLDCPLTNMNVSIEERMKRFTPHSIAALTKLTKYQEHGLQGLSSALQFDGLRLRTLLHFQCNDRIVSNRNEAELYERLYRLNPKHTYLLLGSDGGHIHTHTALAHGIHTFKKKYKSSYDPEYDEQYQETKREPFIAGKLLQPGKKAETVIESYYQECKANIKK